jgi:hypothetical protein
VAAGEFVQVKNSYKLSAGLKGKINKKVSWSVGDGGL